MEEQPDNLDVMLSLATIYEEQGKEENALELANYGIVIKHQHKKKDNNSYMQIIYLITLITNTRFCYFFSFFCAR